MLTKGFPNNSFDPIAYRCQPTMLLGDCQAEPRGVVVIVPAKSGKQTIAAPGGLSKHAAVIGLAK
jgi:hypothetical protein